MTRGLDADLRADFGTATGEDLLIISDDLELFFCLGVEIIGEGTISSSSSSSSTTFFFRLPFRGTSSTSSLDLFFSVAETLALLFLGCGDGSAATSVLRFGAIYISEGFAELVRFSQKPRVSNRLEEDPFIDATWKLDQDSVSKEMVARGKTNGEASQYVQY